MKKIDANLHAQHGVSPAPEKLGPRPPDGWPPLPPDGWMPADDAAEASWSSSPPNLVINQPSVDTGIPGFAARDQAGDLGVVGGLEGAGIGAQAGELGAVGVHGLEGAGIGAQAGDLGSLTPAAAALTLTPVTPIAAIIPPQASGGSQFRLDESGRIDLVPDPPANLGQTQRELYDELRRKARDLSQLGHNQLADLSAPTDSFLDALPENIETVSITRLWSRGNTLRRRLNAHEAVGSAEPSDPARLPALVAAHLRELGGHLQRLHQWRARGARTRSGPSRTAGTRC